MEKFLCIGSEIKYELKDNSGISSDWILKNVIPNIASKFNDKVSLVLGLAVLWEIFDEKASTNVTKKWFHQ